MRSFLSCLVLVSALVGVGLACKGKSAEDEIAARQEAIDAAKAQKEKAAAAKADAQKEGPRDPYWDAESLVALKHEGACPEGLWALFDGPAPGGDDATRAANDAKRAEVAASLKGKTFVAKLRGPSEVTLKDYDAPKNIFPIDVLGTIDCQDSIGRIAVAFTPAKAVPMPTSALSDGPNPQMMWSAPAKSFTAPMKSQSEAKTFAQKHRFGMEASIVFKIGKTDFHHKRVKTAKQTQGEVTIGGTVDDYGAGRLIRADVEAIRVVANPGPVVVVDTRDPAAVSLR